MAAGKKRSKKRSAANSTSTQPEPVFFLDHCLGRYQIAAALRDAGARVEVHTDHFAENIPDEELLSEVGQRGWVFVSKDANIRRRPLERHRLMKAGVRAFFLAAADLRGDEQAKLFARVLSHMVRLCRKPAPFIARITRSGDVAIIEKGRRR